MIESGEGSRDSARLVWRAEGPCLRRVERVPQLCSLILQLNSIWGQLRAQWVCGGAGVHGPVGVEEGWRQGASGTAPLPGRLQPCAASASSHGSPTGPFLSHFPGAQLRHTQGMFSRLKCLQEQRFQPQELSFGCLIPSGCHSFHKVVAVPRGYRLQSLQNLLAQHISLLSCQPVSPSVSLSVTLPALPACLRTMPGHHIKRGLTLLPCPETLSGSESSSDLQMKAKNVSLAEKRPTQSCSGAKNSHGEPVRPREAAPPSPVPQGCLDLLAKSIQAASRAVPCADQERFLLFS